MECFSIHFLLFLNLFNLFSVIKILMRQNLTANFRLFLVAILMLLPCIVSAQKYKISGQVIELEEYTPVQMASVSLLTKDSTAIKSVVTGENGDYTFLVDKKGDYLLKVSFLGFITQVKPVSVQSRTTNVSLTRLAPDAKLLENVDVTGNLPKVQAVEDTLIYNADAYRLPEGSVLEELIERLPGAEVEDGKITINGREVKKILLDGKEFFVGDMNTALKNVPTAIIDKLKHYDEKSDMAKVTGIDDGEEKAVIDVRIKKGMNHGYNVNTDLSYGTHDRYSGRISANTFSEKMKTSLLANGNNANDRSTPGRTGNNRGGGGGGSGLRSSKSVGFNINYDDKKYLQMDGNIRWNHSDSDGNTRSSSESFVSKTGAFSNSNSRSLGRTNGWSAEYRIEWKPSKQWNIQFRPTASISTNDRFSKSANASFNLDPYLFVTDPLAEDAYFGTADTIRVNARSNESMNYSQNRSIGTSVQINRRFSDQGRNLTFRAEASYSDSKQHGITDNLVHLYKVKNKLGNDSTYFTNRYNVTPGKTKNLSAQITYSEPIIKNTFLQFSYRFQYRSNLSDRQTYDFSRLGEQFGYGVNSGYRTWEEYLATVGSNYEEYINHSLSRYSEYDNYIHDLNLTLRLVRTNYDFSLGVRYMPQSSHYRQDYRNVFVDTIRVTSTVTPTATFRYRFSRQKTLNADYHGQTQHPGITQLLDITDDSNPLYISKGNPSLKPAFTNTFNLRYNNYIMARRQSISSNVSLSTTSNSISNKVTYDEETGGRITQPENINGNWNVNGNFQFTSALDKAANWNFSTSTDVRYNHYVSYITLNRRSSSERNVTHTTTASERLSGSYRSKWLEVEVHGRAGLTSARNVLQSNANRDTWNFAYGCSFNITAPWGMIFDTSISQTSRRGYSNSNYNTDELIWTAQISQEIMSRKRLVVSLQFYDILNQQSNFTRQLSANRRSDTWSDGINSYAMLHVVYQLRNFGGRNGRIGGGNRGGNFGGGRGGNFGGGGANRGGGGRAGGRR